MNPLTVQYPPGEVLLLDTLSGSGPALAFVGVPETAIAELAVIAANNATRARLYGWTFATIARGGGAPDWIRDIQFGQGAGAFLAGLAQSPDPPRSLWFNAEGNFPDLIAGGELAAFGGAAKGPMDVIASRELSVVRNSGGSFAPFAVAFSDGAPGAFPGEWWAFSSYQTTILRYSRGLWFGGNVSTTLTGAFPLSTGDGGASDWLWDSTGRALLATPTSADSTVQRYPGLGGAPGAIVADLRLKGANWSTVDGLAFDAAGNLWAADYSLSPPTGRISRLPAAALGANAAIQDPVPDRVLTVPGFSSPGALRFDSAGNLWVAMFADEAGVLSGGAVVRLPAASLVTGPVIPDVVLSGAEAAFALNLARGFGSTIR